MRKNRSCIEKDKMINNPDFYRLKNQVVNDAYNRLIAYLRLYMERDGIKTITITGCEPCVGVTTIVANLAVSMAAAGRKTLFVNTDMKKNMGTDSHAEDQDMGLSHYLKGIALLDDIITATNLENLYYIASGRPESDTVDLLYSKYMLNLYTYVKDKFDVILFDAPSINAVVDASIIAAKTDATILIAKQKTTKISYIESAKREIDHVGAKLLGIVLNQVDKAEYKNYLKHYNYDYRVKIDK